jgi:hypothetical protein
MLPSTESAHALSRLLDLADALSAGIDPDFDPGYDDLDREFQELRLQLARFE